MRGNSSTRVLKSGVQILKSKHPKSFTENSPKSIKKARPNALDADHLEAIRTFLESRVFGGSSERFGANLNFAPEPPLCEAEIKDNKRFGSNIFSEN